MAYIDPAETRQAIRVILSGATADRFVPADRIRGEYWTEASATATRARTLVKPRFDVPAMTIERNASNPSNLGSVVFYNLRFIVECVYDLPEPVATDEAKDRLRASAEQDADVFARALMLNLGREPEDAGGVMNGSCMFESMEPILEDWEARVLRTRQRFRCIAQATQ
jgi:hypothetical protein